MKVLQDTVVAKEEENKSLGVRASSKESRERRFS
jgi:hypothetical protein